MKQASLVVCLFIAACSETEPSSSPDAAVASPDAPTTNDAGTDAPAVASLVGTFTTAFEYGPRREDYMLVLDGGPVSGTATVSRQLIYGYGDYLDCMLVEQMSGTWATTVMGTTTRFELTPTSGVTARVDSPRTGTCEANEIYAQRAMTSEELVERTFFSGDIVARDDASFVVMADNVTWGWVR